MCPWAQTPPLFITALCSQVALTCPQPASRLGDAGPVLDSAGMHTDCELQKQTDLQVGGNPRPQKAS